MGYGNNYDIVDVENEEAAGKAAYEAWNEDIQQIAGWKAVGEATKELREEYGL